MSTKILIENVYKEKAIELPDGTVLDLPERTAELYEDVVSLEKARMSLSEYDYCKKLLELFYGKEGFKKIAPNGKKTNLDYLERVQIISLNLFLSEKIEAEKEEMERKAEFLAPITNKLEALNPTISKLQ